MNTSRPIRQLLLLFAGLLLTALPAAALDQTNIVFKVFQFPSDKIPTIDGQTNDWDIVPESYVITTDQMIDDSGKKQPSDPAAPKIRACNICWA